MYSFGQIMAGGLNTVSGPFHPFGGAVDIIVVKQEDGSFKSTPFYVRFGKFQGVLKRREKLVHVSVNGEEAQFCMYLDHRGQAYFLHEKEVEELVGEGDASSMFSPGGSSGDEGPRPLPELLLETPSGNFREATLEDLGSLKQGQGLELVEPEGESANDSGSAEPSLASQAHDGQDRRGDASEIQPSDADVFKENEEDASRSRRAQSEAPLDSPIAQKKATRTPKDFVRSASAPPSSSPAAKEVELRSVLSSSPALEGKGYNFEEASEATAGQSLDSAVSAEEQAMLKRDQAWRRVVRKAARAVEASPPLLKAPLSEEAQKPPSWDDSSRRTSEEEAVMQEHPDKASWGWGSWWYKSPPEGMASQHPSQRQSQSEVGSSKRSSYKTGDDDVNDPKEVILGFESARNSFADFGALNQESEREGPSDDLQSPRQPQRSIFGRLFGTGAAPPPVQTPVRKLQRTESQEGFSRKGGRLDVNSDFQEDLDSVLKQKMVWGPAPEKKQDQALEDTSGVKKGSGAKRDEVEAALSSLADDLLKEKSFEEGSSRRGKRGGKVAFKREGLQALAHRTSSGGFLDAPGLRDKGAFASIDEVPEGEKEDITHEELYNSKDTEEESKADDETGTMEESMADEEPATQSGSKHDQAAKPEASFEKDPLDRRYQSRVWRRHLSRKDSESDTDDVEIEFAAGGHGLEASILMAELENEILAETPEEGQRTEERLKEQPLRLWDGMDLAEAVAAVKNSVGGEEGRRLEELLKSRSKKDGKASLEKGWGKPLSSKRLRSMLQQELAEVSQGPPQDAGGESAESATSVEEDEAEDHFLEKQRQAASDKGRSEASEESAAPVAERRREEAEGAGPSETAESVHAEPDKQLKGFDVSPVASSSLATARSAPVEIPKVDVNILPDEPPLVERRAASLPGPPYNQEASFAEIRDRLQQLEGAEKSRPTSALKQLLDQPISQSAPVSGINTPLVFNQDSKPATEPGTTQSTPPSESAAPIRTAGKPPLSRSSPLRSVSSGGKSEELPAKAEGFEEGPPRREASEESAAEKGELRRGSSLHGEEVLDASDPLRVATSDEEKGTVVEGEAQEDAHAQGSVSRQEEKAHRQEEKAQSAMELSLCRHLLLPGMGSEAADSAFKSEAVSFDRFMTNPHAIVSNERLVCRVEGRYYPWKVVAPTVLGMLAFGRVVPTYAGPELDGAIPVEKREPPKPEGEDAAQQGGWRLWPFGSKQDNRGQRPSTPEPGGVRSRTASPEPAESTEASEAPRPAVRRKRKCKLRTLIPTSEELASLNLHDGKNKITFAFTTRVWGKQEVDATIHLWKWNSRVIISDVDGTITKSDLMGQIAPLIGRDWSQSGVASLFSAIKENGYEFMYLSARAISQSATTRAFLSSIKQDGKQLPDGPIVISPDGMIPSLYREVIRRTPHEFKIACLNEIRALFPPNTTPFYAGFGNRDTDEISYLAVGIARGKIFTINPKGEVVANKVSVDVCGYDSMRRLVNDMFPSVNRIEQEDYNSWNYWKIPVPDIDEDELLESKKREEDGRKKEEARKREEAKKKEEQKKKDEVKRREEERKKVEDARRKKVEDDKRKREEDVKRREDERKRAEEEVKRKREDDKRRREDEKKRVEEGRRRAEQDKRRADEERRKGREDKKKADEADRKSSAQAKAARQENGRVVQGERVLEGLKAIGGSVLNGVEKVTGLKAEVEKDVMAPQTAAANGKETNANEQPAKGAEIENKSRSWDEEASSSGSQGTSGSTDKAASNSVRAGAKQERQAPEAAKEPEQSDESQPANSATGADADEELTSATSR